MMRRRFQGAGQRLSDGAPGHAKRSPWRDGGTAIAAALVAAVALTTCPSHDSFEAFCVAAESHPSGFLGGLSAITSRFHAAVAAETRSYLLFRVGHFRGGTFVGALGTWVSIPTLPSSAPGLFALPTAAVCHGRGQGTPHELFALLCILVFVLAQASPGFIWRHCSCSWSAVRSGRPWVLLTSNLTHFSPMHLVHNLLQVLHMGPVIYHYLGCEKTAALIACAALASSGASVLYHGWFRRRPSEASVGASGVVMGLVAANAALFPNVAVHMYGFELSAAAVPFVYMLLDALGQRQDNVDISAHFGGALCGWALVQRWRPWWARL